MPELQDYDPLGIKTPRPSPSPTPQQGDVYDPLGLGKSIQAPEQPTIGGVIRSISPVANLAGEAADYIAQSKLGQLGASYAQPVLSKLTPVFDFLGRGQYASAKFFDSLTDNSKSIFDSISDAFGELFAARDKQQKLSFSDVIRHREPDFARDYPKTATVLGFIGDLALDPLSYLGAGFAREGISVGTKVLTKTGREALAEGLATTTRKIFAGSEGTLQLVENLPKIEKSAERLTQTAEAFDKRFADSVIRDENNDLKVVYHGTAAPEDFKQFKKEGFSSTASGYGNYFTENPEAASNYAAKQGANARVIPVYLNIKNPLIYDEPVTEELLKTANKLDAIQTTKKRLSEIKQEEVDNIMNRAKAGEQISEEERQKLADFVSGHLTGEGFTDKYVSTIPDNLTNGQVYGMIVDKLAQTKNVARTQVQQEATNLVKKLGFDGIQYETELGKEYVAFSPKQIVNAISSNGTTAQAIIEKGIGPFGELNALAGSGYFQAVKARANQINEFAEKYGATELGNAPENLAKAELYADLKRQGADLNPAELRQRVEQRVNILTQLDPKIAENLLQTNRGLFIKGGLPFGKQVDLFKVIGSEVVINKVKELNSALVSAGKFGSVLGKVENIVGATFNRNYNLPDEYVKLRDGLEAYLSGTTDSTIRATRKLFKDIDKDGRERIGEAMQWIDDQSRNLEQLRGGSQNVANDEYQSVVQLGLQRAKLAPQEQAIVAELFQSYKDMGTAEMQADLLKHSLANYSPRGYNAIVDGNDFTAITRGKFREAGGPNPYLSSSQERKYMTNAEAKAAGLDHEFDAAVLYANRALASQRALAIKQFKDSVVDLFGTYQYNAKYAHTGILPTGKIKESDLPRNVLDDMKMIGESVIPSGLSQNTRDILRGIDLLQRPFKISATIVRPTFAARQLVSNTIQAAMISGIKSFKSFDPRAAIDAAMVFFRRKETGELPEFLSNFINKTFLGSDAVLAERAVMANIAGEERLVNFAKDFKMTNPFGESLTGEDLVNEMRTHGVFREFDSTGETFSKKMNQELSRDEGNKQVAFELGKYWKHAQMVEDYNRAMLYMNGRRLGHSAEESAKLVNKALFDYQFGLSNIEKQVIKRVIPFYSFQRFAIPYVLKQTLQQPGNYGAIQKFIGTIEKLIVNGDTLNPAEQEQIPGFVLEQPKLFTGFDKDKKAGFNILNNITPYDVLNLMVFDKEGNIDYKRTAEKSVLGAITPFIKVPLEMLLDQNFFTGKTIEQASSLGDLHNGISKVIPKPVKELIGWEDRTNKISGKTTTFMNPYLAYSVMNYFPVVRDYVKPFDKVDASWNGALDAAMNIFYEQLNPIKKTSVDLKAQQEYQLLHTHKDIRELISNLRSSIYKGSESKEAQARLDLVKLAHTFKDNAELRNQFEVRGQGLGRINEEVAPAQNPTPDIAPPMNR